MLNEARNDLSTLKVDMAELEELRDFRSDIARKEKAHAELIANQAKRLEELEGLYKEEQVRPPDKCLCPDWLPTHMCDRACDSMPPVICRSPGSGCSTQSRT
jgi:hypothetical protein